MMTSYYTAIVVLVWLTLGTLSILVHENRRISWKNKRLFYLTYMLIAFSALAEWCGVLLNGRTDMPRWLLKAVKCADYCLTPMAGGALAAQLRQKNGWQKAMECALLANTVFQLTAVFTDWMIVIDSQNSYAHGPLYPVYIGIYLIVIVLLIAQFVIYGRSFTYQNRVSLYAIILITCIGILMQEMISGVRTAYLGVTLGAAMVFIRFTEFSQITTDEFIEEQKTALNTDPLTGLFSRYAYSNMLQMYNDGELPTDTAVFSIDLNALKETNDSLGHEAGDELIRGAADCISEAFGDKGQCYRTGGDEFVVFRSGTSRENADRILELLKEKAAAWQGTYVKKLSFAVGYALAEENSDMNVEKLVGQADQAMYRAKAAYYQTQGIDRRKSRVSRNSPQ